MEIAEQTQGAVRIMRPNGPLTGDSGAALVDRVRRNVPAALGRVLLDLSEVTHVDSKGIEGLLAASDVLAELGQSLRLCSVSRTLEEVLRVTGHASAFDVHPDAHAGVRSFL